MLGYLILKILHRDPRRILYEPVLFLALACAVYYAFGPLLYVMGPADAIEYSRSWYWVDATDALWLTGINFIGFGLAGSAYSATRLPTLAIIVDSTANAWSKISIATTFAAFLTIGLVAKYLFVLPYELLLIQSEPTGTTRQLARLLLAALLIGFAYRDAERPSLYALTKFVLVGEIITGILMFNKTETLVAIIAAMLGHYYYTRRLRTLLIAACIAALVYISIGSVVTFGRNELVARGGGVPIPADLRGRFEIIGQYFGGGETQLRPEEISGAWWSRLNYLPSQQSAIDLYHENNGGDDLSRLPWIFIPRLLYPDKPIMSVAGYDLTEKITGRRHSSTGIGVFVDGYYNLGWLGLVIGSLAYGYVLRAYSVMSFGIVKRRAVIMYPLVFMGIYAGVRADGWLLIDVAGPLVTALVLLGLFHIFSRR